MMIMRLIGNNNIIIKIPSISRPLVLFERVIPKVGLRELFQACTANLVFFDQQLYHFPAVSEQLCLWPIFKKNKFLGNCYQCAWYFTVSNKMHPQTTRQAHMNQWFMNHKLAWFMTNWFVLQFMSRAISWCKSISCNEEGKEGEMLFLTISSVELHWWKMGKWTISYLLLSHGSPLTLMAPVSPIFPGVNFFRVGKDCWGGEKLQS